MGVLLAAAIDLEVPFVPQGRDTCGAAALAMVMRYWGREVAHDEIARALVEPELRGIRGSRLADFARERGMVAIAFAGDVALLRDHLAKGRPLVLAIDAGRGRFHDVVAVGFDEGRGEVIVHDPARGPTRRLAAGELERKWEKSGRWTLLVQPSERATEADTVAMPPIRSRRDFPVRSPAGPGDEGSAREAGGGPKGGGYDMILAQALELGRAERYPEAAPLLDRAIALEPGRPEAWTERGGLRFLEGRYEDAAGDLRRALAIRDEAYARDLLASSLHLAGRELEALAVWNPMGRPTLHTIEIGGLQHTKDEVARREIALAVGAVLTPAGVRSARRRLDETGVFDRITLRPVPRGDGEADLDVALGERQGFADGPADFLLTTAVNLIGERVRLRYRNLGGRGISLGASLRWQENRPEAALTLQWPRPLSLPAYLRLAGFRGEQAYDVGGGFDMRRRGLDLALRQVLPGGTVAQVALRLRDRAFSTPRPDAPPGLLAGIELGLESRLVETRRHRLDTAARVLAAGPAIGSKVTYGQADGELRYEGVLSKPEGLTIERSVLAVRLRGGWGSAGQPVDEMYALGISLDSELPLRAHPLTRDGVLGANPIARSVVLLNAEWRQRLLHRPGFDVGAVAFSDTAWVARPAEGSVSGRWHDIGLGLRISLLGGPTIRLDGAWSLTDGRRALFVGLSQAF
jgi:hypothetical protein